MAPKNEKSHLKRTRVWTFLPRSTWSPLGALFSQFFQGSLPDEAAETKKPRRSGRLSSQLAPNANDTDKTPVKRDKQLPSPLTRGATDGSSDMNRESTPTPAGAKTEDETTPRFQSQGLSSPPQDTQPLSQFADRHPAFIEDAEEEEAEGVWGYLVALDPRYGDKPIVLKRRSACPLPDSIAAAAAAAAAANGEADKKSDVPETIREEEAYERTKVNGIASGGYLIGRHPECGKY